MVEGLVFFEDKLTDLEDELQRMKALCEKAGEERAAKAAAKAASALLELSVIVIQGHGRVPLAEAY